jgi:hypothetical protein
MTTHISDIASSLHTSVALPSKKVPLVPAGQNSSVEKTSHPNGNRIRKPILDNVLSNAASRNRANILPTFLRGNQPSGHLLVDIYQTAQCHIPEDITSVVTCLPHTEWPQGLACLFFL